MSTMLNEVLSLVQAPGWDDIQSHKFDYVLGANCRKSHPGHSYWQDFDAMH